MKIRICARPGCGLEIPGHFHKNTKYCCYECYYENKKAVTTEEARKKLFERSLLINDTIVGVLYRTHDGKFLVRPEQFTTNFSWKINAGETTISGIRVTKLVNYGYTIYPDLNIQLWKI